MERRPPSVGVPGMGPGPDLRKILSTIPASTQRNWKRTREWGYDDVMPYDRAERRRRTEEAWRRLVEELQLEVDDAEGYGS